MEDTWSCPRRRTRLQVHAFSRRRCSSPSLGSTSLPPSSSCPRAGLWPAWWSAVPTPSRTATHREVDGRRQRRTGMKDQRTPNTRRLAPQSLCRRTSARSSRLRERPSERHPQLAHPPGAHGERTQRAGPVLTTATYTTRSECRRSVSLRLYSGVGFGMGARQHTMTSLGVRFGLAGVFSSASCFRGC